jgi:hypothetical protein
MIWFVTGPHRPGGIALSTAPDWPVQVIIMTAISIGVGTLMGLAAWLVAAAMGRSVAPPTGLPQAARIRLHPFEHIGLGDGPLLRGVHKMRCRGRYSRRQSSRYGRNPVAWRFGRVLSAGWCQRDDSRNVPGRTDRRARSPACRRMSSIMLIRAAGSRPARRRVRRGIGSPMGTRPTLPGTLARAVHSHTNRCPARQACPAGRHQLGTAR